MKIFFELALLLVFLAAVYGFAGFVWACVQIGREDKKQ